ncbi:MAG: hypothetical protein ACKN9V_05565 [Pseudomonadota bacterium]
MRRFTGLVGLLTIVVSFAFLAQAERPREREKERGREEKKKEKVLELDEHGRPCEGACKAISSGRGTEVRAQEDPRIGKEASIIEASIKAVKEPKLQSEVRNTLENQVKDLDSNAKEGLLFREEMFAKFRSSESAEAKLESKNRGVEGAFLTSLVGRLKENWKDQLETLKKLVCASECGHRGMGKSCRAITLLAQKLTPALIPAGVSTISAFAVHEVLKGDGTKMMKVDVSFDGTEEIRKLEFESKEQPEEKVSANKESK